MNAAFRPLVVVFPWLVIAGTVVGVLVVAAAPPLRERLTATLAKAAGVKLAEEPDEHAGHNHGAHGDANSIELSEQAQANIGLQLGTITLTTTDRSITIPGMLVERPARSTVAVTAPLTGIVMEIYPIEGEAVGPAQKLFDLRLTHEELVQAQGDFLRVAEELDVIEMEIKRLEKIAAEGGIPNRQVLERQYERQNKQAVLRAQHQALLLHGLSETQVSGILKSRKLLQTLTVSVPIESADEDESDEDKTGEGQTKAGKTKAVKPKQYEIQELRVARGQSVTAGETLAILTDHSELYVEGNAFDKDVASINKAVENGWEIKAVLETDDAKPEVIEKLKILYVAGKVDPESRTFHFYLPLANTLFRDVTDSAQHRFISWRYKPGQRVQLTVPVEQWKKRIVLPVDAVAQDGIETYVFVPNGKRFDRKPVHVEYRDRFKVVIANDGSVFEGDAVALSGAQQMQLALKNKSGGAVDPHAGHNH
jgi:membrane fusion protein, heavy metal efflux system